MNAPRACVAHGGGAQARGLGGKLARFATVGLVSTLIYAALGLAASALVGLSPMAATVAAYAGAALFSYLAHRNITFRSARAHSTAVPSFAAATICGFWLALALTFAAERLGLPYAAAVALTCVIVPAFNFLVLDRLVFRSAGSKD